MASPTYTLRPVEQSDIPILSDLLYTSKLSLTINRLLFQNWPNEAVQRRNYAAVFDHLDSSTTEALAVCDATSGELIGQLALTRKRPVPVDAKQSPPPKSENEAEKKADKADDTVFNQEVLGAVMEAMRELTADVAEIDHYEITYIVLQRSHRHRGIGRELVQYVFNKAKATGIPVRVCAEPQVYRFFTDCGFEYARHVDIDLAQWAPPYSGFGVFRLASLVWKDQE